MFRDYRINRYVRFGSVQSTYNRNPSEWEHVSVEQEEELRRVHELIGTRYSIEYKQFFIRYDFQRSNAATVYALDTMEPCEDTVVAVYEYERTDIDTTEDTNIIGMILRSRNRDSIREYYGVDTQRIVDYLISIHSEI